MDTYIDNYAVLENRAAMWDCHINTLCDYFMLNGIELNDGLLYLLTEKMIPEFGTFYVKKIKLGMIAKGPNDIIRRVLDNLHIPYVERIFPDDATMEHLASIIDAGEIPLLFYDNVIICEDGIAKEGLIYFRHFSSSLLIGYNDDQQEGILSRKSMVTNDFKRFQYHVLHDSLYSHLMPIAVNGRYLVLKPLTKEQKQYICEQLNTLAITSIKKSLSSYFRCEVVDQGMIEDTMKLYSDEMFLNMDILPGKYYAGQEAYNNMIAYLTGLRDSISGKSVKIDSANKLFWLKLSKINAELKVSPTYYFVDLHRGLQYLFDMKSTDKEREQSMLEVTYDLVTLSRELTRMLRGYKKKVIRKISYLNKIIELVEIIGKKNTKLYQELDSFFE